MLPEVHLRSIMLEQIEQGGQVMRDVLDPVTAVEAMSHVVRHHRYAHIERVADDMNDLRLRKGHPQQRQVHLVEGHPVGKEGVRARAQAVARGNGQKKSRNIVAAYCRSAVQLCARCSGKG